MNGQRLKVLMLEQNPSFVRLMHRALKQAYVGEVSVNNVPSIEEAEEALSTEIYDTMVLDLASLSQAGNPLEAFDHFHDKHPTIPIVVLAHDDDYELSLQVMRRGAQDYLIKDKVTGQLLVRSLRYAIERQHMMDTMRRLAMLDELTRLYNANGFNTLVQQHMQLARRTESKFILIVADIVHMNTINKQFGREVGDKVLLHVAELLRRTFRSSDILARINGDEFAVLAIDVDEQNLEGLLTRLQANLLSQNLQEKQAIHFDLHIGIALFKGDERHKVKDLLTQARQNIITTTSVDA